MTNIVDDWFERGVAKGRAEGRLEGRAEALAESMLGVLTERRIPMSEAQRAMILGYKDLEQVRGWLRKALTAGSPDDFIDSR